MAVWLILMGAETVHGTLRTILLAPRIGDFQARQISVFTGSLLILALACLFIRWIRAGSAQSLVAVGLGWLTPTLLFELGLGHFVLHRSWEALASEEP